MKEVEKKRVAASQFQQRLSLSLLIVVVFIAGIVLWLQNNYDPAAWREQHSSAVNPQAVDEVFPEGLTPLSPPEQYKADNLSDKINGKADLYLSAGFKLLHSRRFALASDANRWMERYVYDMGGHENAFAVFSAQRRKDGLALDLGSMAYLSANGLFMVHGFYYVEVVASETSDVLVSQMKALATAFVSAHPTEHHPLAELDLFVSDHQVPHTKKLMAGSAFGIQNLDWVYSAGYAAGNDEATVFIAKRKTGAEAGKMAELFISHWMDYGGEAATVPGDLKGARAVLILDVYEITATQGRYLFGVHEATSLDFGLELMTLMQRSIDGTGGEDGQ